MSDALTLPEAGWQQTVVDTAQAYGWWVHHHFDSRRSTAGWPDLVLLRPPEAIFVELKTDAGRIRPEQREVLAALEACGLETHIWRPRDFYEMAERLRTREGAPHA